MINKKSMENLISCSVKENRLILYYQPIYNTEKRAYTKAEVLLRMIDRENNIIYPNDFIPIAEENGDIVEIGYYVLETLCEKICGNKDFCNMMFSVNVSPIQLGTAGFAEKAIGIIERHNIDRKNIIFEFTESVPYSFTGIVKDNVDILNSRGYKMSLDDMGKGASDIKKAMELPIKYLKIDKKYIDNVATDGKVANLINAIILFSKTNKIKTVAEGVETEEQKETLLKMKCEYLQGYYFSKPVTENEFIKLMKKVI